MAEPSAADIDHLVFEKFPLLRVVAVALSTTPSLALGKETRPEIAEQVARLEAARAEFLAMPREHLLALIASSPARAQAAARERNELKQAAGDAQRFYNQPKAAADFGYWCKLPYWTLDEAVALLLGRDPHVVNSETLERELTQSSGVLKMGKPPERRAFHQTYARLRTLLARAEGLNVDSLKPAELVSWALRSKSIQLPEKLAQLEGTNSGGQTTEFGQAPAGPESPTSKRRAGTPKVWTTAELEKLKQHRAIHGTKASAEHFGISESRIRELLPGRAKKMEPASTPFTSFVHRMK